MQGVLKRGNRRYVQNITTLEMYRAVHMQKEIDWHAVQTVRREACTT
jgi:hypothetical protein